MAPDETNSGGARSGGDSGSLARATTLLLGPFALALVACQADGAHPPATLAGALDQLEYRVRPGEPLCPAALASIDGYLRALAERLETTWPAGPRITYHRYRDREDLRTKSPCPARHTRCTELRADRAIVHTDLVVDRHELTHAFLAHAGLPHPVLAEGVAEIFQCRSASLDWRPPLDWRAALFLPDGSVSYPEAARLVRSLLDRFGPRVFLAAYGASRPEADPERFAQAFARLFGTSLEEAWRTAATAPWPDGIGTICPCQGKSVPTDGSDTPVRSCQEGDDAFREATFSLAEPGLVFVETLATLPDGDNGPRACDGTPVAPHRFSVVGPDERHRALTVAPLAAGRYFMARVDRLRVTATAPAGLEDCNATPAYALTPGAHYASVTFRPPAPAPLLVRLSIPTPQTIATASADLLVCPDCAAARAFRESCRSARETWPPGSVVTGEPLLLLPPEIEEAHLVLAPAP